MLRSARRLIVLAVLFAGIGLAFADAKIHRSEVKPQVKEDGSGFPTPFAPPTPPPKK